MIRLVPTTIADEAIKNLYEEAFPEEERRPWNQQLSLVASGKLQLLRIVREDAFAGFIFYWNLPAFSFIEHFAIHPAARGGGAGTQVMQLMEAQLNGIVLEVEPPVTEQAIRRIKFYERLGYQTFAESYYQPPYYPHYPPLELRLMQKGLPPAAATFPDIKNQLYKYVYNK
ncbi:GNAT family N-acetyltransferase [Chitinophaga ginsengisegetis]|uniref:GNAT family N-acetyltransferase n=1 Tax=Chitinophaga ginsengisegetis TaxID=393003 RepID=UPI000DBABD91|nr:GNAT family N-acetyltransferase [Chitinophaga ginsengisegetis]MDR6565407.1 ribosomal protein S18 acetylase RimI-like enzyme [Chitinophaga ginsengisegetis]MDR6645135.1 ribosomal protein S18 acetylase RimI-like enzyme [Chitinophaga ginsengisegetis]MDR6652273.1 ribosomal protein S18 acetylase RimI-like enzyme [Chitinophaga ginsengisegetis]